jgi:hypothetical protein
MRQNLSSYADFAWFISCQSSSVRSFMCRFSASQNSNSSTACWPDRLACVPGVPHDLSASFSEVELEF